jgi:hypothetical protein
MSEQRKKVAEYLREWGFDIDTFEERAKQSAQTAKGDLSEITGALRQTLVEAKDILIDLSKKGPAATELKSGFERAWEEIEGAFSRARDRVRESKQPKEPPATEPDEVVQM